MILNSLNIILHTTGSTSLIALYGKCKCKTQRLYIINLSLTTALLNFLELVKNIPDFVGISLNMRATIKIFQHYMLLVEFTGISLVYYVTMIILTVDRFLKVRFGLKYNLYWNETKAKYLTIILWILGIFTSIGIFIASYIYKFDWENFFFKFFYPILEISFIFIAVVTYVSIFRLASTSTHRVTTVSDAESIRGTIAKLKDLRKSYFLIPSFLISTFIVFMIIPDFVYLFVVIINRNQSEILSVTCWLSYSVSNLFDACFYIYFYSDVRRHILKTALRYLRQSSTNEIII